MYSFGGYEDLWPSLITFFTQAHCRSKYIPSTTINVVLVNMMKTRRTII